MSALALLALSPAFIEGEVSRGEKMAPRRIDPQSRISPSILEYSKIIVWFLVQFVIFG